MYFSVPKSEGPSRSSVDVFSPHPARAQTMMRWFELVGTTFSLLHLKLILKFNKSPFFPLVVAIIFDWISYNFVSASQRIKIMEELSLKS